MSSNSFKITNVKFVTLMYWLQEEAVCNDEIPYYEKH